MGVNVELQILLVLPSIYIVLRLHATPTDITETPGESRGAPKALSI